MKMRQPLSHFERAFAEETALDRDRRESLRKTTERRAGCSARSSLGARFCSRVPQ